LNLVCNALLIYYYVVILRIVLRMIVDFGRMGWGHPVRKVEEFLGLAVDPLLRPLRAVIPSVPIGGIQLDLSPLVLIIGIGILLRTIC
jgi:YggT family protein